MSDPTQATPAETLAALRAEQDSENAAHVAAHGGAAHSHPEDVTDVETVTVTCPHCSASSSLTVPSSHDGSRIRVGCGSCGEDFFTDGPAPHELQVAATLSPAEHEAILAGRLAMVNAGEGGTGAEATSAAG